MPSYRDLFSGTPPIRPYRDRLAVGLAYEGYVVERLRAYGFLIKRNEDADEQFQHGDVTFRFGDCEIKYDANLHKTGNLFIEIGEKQYAEQPEWKFSGICGPSRYLWIGDYRDWILLSCQYLIERMWRDHYGPFTIGHGTARGFLLKWSTALPWALWTGQWSDNQPDRPHEGTLHNG